MHLLLTYLPLKTTLFCHFGQYIDTLASYARPTRFIVTLRGLNVAFPFPTFFFTARCGGGGRYRAHQSQGGVFSVLR